LVISDSQWDSERAYYIGICSEDYDHLDGTGFNLSATSKQSTIDVSTLNTRSINGWKASTENASSINFNANALIFSGAHCYVSTNVFHYSFTPYSSSAQISAFFTRIKIIYEHISHNYIRHDFYYSYITNASITVSATAQYYMIIKTDDKEEYTICFKDNLGKNHTLNMKLTSSSCIMYNVASEATESSSVSSVQFCVIGT
jgi:hypothetical protein